MFKYFHPEMSDAEILRWLRRFQHDPEFRAENGAKTVPIANFCDFAGVCRRSVYYFMLGQRGLGPGLALRLTDAIHAVKQGLRWRKIKNGTTVIVDPERWESFPRYDRISKGMSRGA